MSHFPGCVAWCWPDGQGGAGGYEKVMCSCITGWWEWGVEGQPQTAKSENGESGGAFVLEPR